jgi:DNA-binding NtrC family response regulator
LQKLPCSDIGVNGIVPVLSVSRLAEDHELLNRFLNGSEFNWDVVQTDTLHSALNLLQGRWFPIVICENESSEGSWKEFLEPSADATAPAVIVTSRTADERLWAEALNLGAYDVLAKPFERREVYRVVDSAWRHWSNSCVETKPKPRPVSAERSKAFVAAGIRAFAASCIT